MSRELFGTKQWIFDDGTGVLKTGSEGNPMLTAQLTRAAALSSLLGFTIAGCQSPNGQSSGQRSAPNFPPSEGYGYLVRAGDSVYSAKSIQFQGDWVVLETMQVLSPAKMQQKEVWVPRSSIRYIEKPGPQ